MVKKCKKLVVLAISIATILTLISCTVNTTSQAVVAETSAARAEFYGGKGLATNASFKMVANDIAVSDMAVEEAGYGSIDKKIIKTVDINAETKTFDETLEWFKSYVKKYDGNINSSYIDLGNMEIENYRKSAHFNVRIPAGKLDAFLNSMGDNLNITFRNENSRDVTEEYDDTESRIATLKIEEEKLNELMKQAKNVEDMIKIEEKLSDVRGELERITRRLKRLDRDVTYSTVNVTINEVKDLTEVTPGDDYSKENILRLIKKNYEDTKKFFVSAGVQFITHLPAIIAFLIGILIILIIMAIYNAVTGKGKEEKNKKKKTDTYDEANQMIYDVIEEEENKN